MAPAPSRCLRRTPRCPPPRVPRLLAGGVSGETRDPTALVLAVREGWDRVRKFPPRQQLVVRSAAQQRSTEGTTGSRGATEPLKLNWMGTGQHQGRVRHWRGQNSGKNGGKCDRLANFPLEEGRHVRKRKMTRTAGLNPGAFAHQETREIVAIEAAVREGAESRPEIGPPCHGHQAV